MSPNNQIHSDNNWFINLVRLAWKHKIITSVIIIIVGSIIPPDVNQRNERIRNQPIKAGLSSEYKKLEPLMNRLLVEITRIDNIFKDPKRNMSTQRQRMVVSEISHQKSNAVKTINEINQLEKNKQRIDYYYYSKRLMYFIAMLEAASYDF
jgi:hypothetical protein